MALVLKARHALLKFSHPVFHSNLQHRKMADHEELYLARSGAPIESPWLQFWRRPRITLPLRDGDALDDAIVGEFDRPGPPNLPMTLRERIVALASELTLTSVGVFRLGYPRSDRSEVTILITVLPGSASSEGANAFVSAARALINT